MEKADLVSAFRALLEERLAALASGRAAARDGTRVDGSHRPANRGERAAVTSQGYLALGLAERAASLRADLDLLAEVNLDPAIAVRPGALVTLLDDTDTPVRLFVLPGGQGDEVHGVTIISPLAPLAAALSGLEAGATVEVRRAGARVTMELAEVE